MEIIRNHHKGLALDILCFGWNSIGVNGVESRPHENQHSAFHINVSTMGQMDDMLTSYSHYFWNQTSQSWQCKANSS